MRFLIKLVVSVIVLSVMAAMALSVMSILAAIVVPSLGRMFDRPQGRAVPGIESTQGPFTQIVPNYVEVTPDAADFVPDIVKAQGYLSPVDSRTSLLLVGGMTTVLAVLGLIALCLTLTVMALRWLRGKNRPEPRQAHADEVRLIQELHRGFARMEERVEALETILLDNANARRERVAK